jgi:hypothetical protein
MKSILVRDFALNQRSFVSFLFGAMLTDFVTRINCISPEAKSRAATTLPGLNWIVTVLALVLALALALALAATSCRNFRTLLRALSHTTDRKSGHYHNADNYPFLHAPELYCC